MQAGDYKKVDDENRTLWQIKPGKKPITLAESGRRPEESPFDGDDRKISLICVEDGRLLVNSSWSHYAYYNPSLAKWEEAPQRTAAEWQKRLQAIEDKSLQARIYPQHRYQFDDGSKGIFSWTTEPGYLPFRAETGPWHNLPVRMSVPDSYRARFQVESDLGLRSSPLGDYEWLAISDMARSNLMAPAILNQTDQSIILTLHPATDVGLTHVIKVTPSLPFLWILDKKEAFAAMRKIQRK